MKIISIHTAIGLSGFAHKDLAGIKSGVVGNGFFYDGRPVTAGFQEISQESRVMSVLLRLENGSVAHGDCLDVIFAGAAGREGPFAPEEHLEVFETRIRPWLANVDPREFRQNAEAFEAMATSGDALHMALRYGVSQALLNAAALARGTTMAEVVAADYGATIGQTIVPILVSIPKTDPLVLDRMIMKRADLLPHASFTVVETDLGPDGRFILDYAQGLSQRISQVGAPDYRPTIHLDTYGTIGEMTKNDIAAITDFLGALAQAASPYPLYIESPIIAETQEEQIRLYAELRQAIRAAGLSIRLIVDEWCNTLEDIRLFHAGGAADMVQIKAPDLGGLGNTIEAVLFCKEAGIGCCLGGTANDTDQSSRIATHIAQACGADFLLGRPGLGGDAALMIMRNEMARTLALVGSGV
jgi:methylaspartate ammonia-lyase